MVLDSMINPSIGRDKLRLVSLLSTSCYFEPDIFSFVFGSFLASEQVSVRHSSTFNSNSYSNFFRFRILLAVLQ